MSSITVTTTLGGTTTSLQCISGFVNLFQFIIAPQPGSVIGQIQTVSGTVIPLVQTQPTPIGGIPLSSVDGRFATLCGSFVRVDARLAFDVRLVNPGAPSPTGTPLNNQLLLLLLLLLLLRGGGFGLGTTLGLGGLTGISGLDVNTLLAQVQASGLNVNQLLAQAGFGQVI